MTKRKSVTPADKAIRFLESLKVPEGPLHGKRIRLAPFQKRFIEGALAKGTNIAALSVARGSGKTTLTAGLALGALLGVWDDQPRREIPIAARTQEQGKIAYNYAVGLARSLPNGIQERLTFRRSPRYAIEFEDGDDGPHLITVIAADGKSALGMSPAPLAICDERSAWPTEQGDELEQSILSALGKRRGRCVIISTSAPSDGHRFSKLLDEAQPGIYTQSHVPEPGLPADDVESLKVANPGCEFGIGPSIEWLVTEARRCISEGGSSLSRFRNLNRNERVHAEIQNLILTPDEWLRCCETESLPSRQGPLAIGVDLGGSSSMTASAFFWYETGRLECRAWFPAQPSLADRGSRDGVGDRYCQMAERGELSTLGNGLTVPIDSWLSETMRHVEGENVVALLADRYKAAEFQESLARCGIRCPIQWRGFGWKDGAEDVERAKRMILDGKVKSAPSLLLRSGFRDAVVVRDPAGNAKLAKGRSLGKIDSVAASILAIAEGARRQARPVKKLRYAWN